MDIRPFAALHPTAQAAASIAALPYDVVSADEARAIVAAQPLSFLAIDLPETAFDPSVDPYSPEVYAKGAELFSSLGDKGLLEQDAEPAFYVYRLEQGDLAMTGLFALVGVAEYERGAVKRHENTRRAKEDDRVRHIEALGAQTGPVFLAYRDGDEDLTALLSEAAQSAPLFDFTDAQGVHNQVWRVDDPELLDKIGNAASQLPGAYIADGHHRAASAVRVAQSRRDADPSGEAQGFMAVLFPASELAILPYNRVVADKNGLDSEHLLAAIEETGFSVTPAPGPVDPARKGVFGLVVDGLWYEMAMMPKLAAEVAGLPAADALDVAVLQDRVLGPILGVDDPREDPRIDFVGGVRGLDELACRAGADGVAVSCHATGIDELLSVADAGDLMPPKSTWFEPKLRSGLLFHRL